MRGSEVVIIPDNDAPGEKYAETVKAILERLDCNVRILRLGGDEGDDIYDWIERNNDVHPALLAEYILKEHT